MTLTVWLIFVFALAVSFYLPISQLVLLVVRRAHSAAWRKDGRVVCLTFDDGPDPARTPAILEVMRTHRVRGTFFVLGEKAMSHADLLARLSQGGHEICEHGYSHLHPWRSMPWSYLRDLLAGHRALDALCSASRSRAYRPTYGKGNGFTLLYTSLFRRMLTFWNVDPHDYSSSSVHELVQRTVLGVHNTTGAAVVLLHDGRTPNWEGDPLVTPMVVDGVCRKLLGEGYKFLTVSQLKAATGTSRRT